MIHISLRQLEYFLAAARYGGAARAAEALHVSQPSISKAVADLEALWGEALFVRRHARGMDLTAAGSVRQREAQALIECAQRLQGPRTAAMAGLLRLGYLSTLGPRWVPAIVAQMRKSHPQVEIALVEGDTESLTRGLERGELDVALQYDLGLARPRLALAPVADLAPYALLPWGHALAHKATVRLAELARSPLVLIGLPHSREYFLSLFRDAGAAPEVAFETESLEMARSLVANGLGVGLLTTRPVVDRAHDGKRLACRRLSGSVARQSVVMVFPRSMASPLVQPLLPVVRSLFARAA
ncbi:HTH-type transcriptional regulator gltC [Delftia tsuruhatensis]|uniref:LysR substrate-binding domain-containing protein n=1 Tax=Delftia tsuruhatensis TaxID=180282 RepID=UPI001E7BD223|nr:LysR substrate-binding domain-containing protein [Delftia tsuruhatensis]CAB5681635.1 HTH-type transcriptional regulator gltC [Delftia tsuruhatensis]CAC9675700.1 HTH-type transcriptional regulator gltC [Delftia tsuruhatensis]